MIVDAVLLLYEQLADVSTGLNTLLSTVPRDTADSAPPTVSVAHAYSAAWLARGGLEREKITTSPRVDVLPAPSDVGTAALSGVAVTGSPVEVLVRYAVRGADTHTLRKNATQTLRTAIRVLSAPWNDSTFADISRNNVAFDPPEFRMLPFVEEDGDDLVLAALLVTIRAVDRWQMGATP